MKKQKFQIGIHNSINGSPLELHFLDDIYDEYDWWSDTGTNMVEDVINQVKNANPSQIKLIINSVGGDVNIGLAIYNFLKAFNAQVETEIIGMAGSIASVMAMAADAGKLKIARNGFVVIHQAWGGAAGNSSDLRSAADMVDKYTAQIVDIYVQRTGKTKEEIEALIATGDYWMTGQEAIELGFADELLSENDNFQIAAAIKDLPDEYKNVPKELIPINNEIEANQNGILQTLNNNFMDFKKQVSAFIDSIKGKTVPNNDKAAIEVANLIQEPIANLITGIEAEVTNEVKGVSDRVGEIEKVNAGLEKTVTDAVVASLEDRLKAIEDANDGLKKENDTLKQEIANKIGKQTSSKEDPETPVAIGRFSKVPTEE